MSDWDVLLTSYKRGGLAAVKALLKATPDLVSRKSIQGNTLLHDVAAVGYEDLAKLLLDNGADVNARGAVIDCTPLDTALLAKKQARLFRESKHAGMVRLLRRYGGRETPKQSIFG